MKASSRQNKTSARVSTPEQAFGRVLRRIREERSVSQEALAYMGGYHRTYIGQLERGEKSPSLRTIFALAASLDVTPSNLLKEVEVLLPR
jgi:transcriptional regulator with XRE-family HTH domain